MTEQLHPQLPTAEPIARPEPEPTLDTYSYLAEQRAMQPITLERPRRELEGDSRSQRRQVNIDNLRFRLAHADELNLGIRKIGRMQRALNDLEYLHARNL